MFSQEGVYCVTSPRTAAKENMTAFFSHVLNNIKEFLQLIGKLYQKVTLTLKGEKTCHKYQFAITWQAPIIWNDIPLSVRNNLTVSNYKKNLGVIKTVFFSE